MFIDVLFWFVFFGNFELILCRPKTDIPLFEACHGEECTWYANSRYIGCRSSDDFLLRFPYFDKSSTIDFRCLSVQQIFIRSDFDCRDIPLIVEHAKNMPSVFMGEAEIQCQIPSTFQGSTKAYTTSTPMIPPTSQGSTKAYTTPMSTSQHVSTHGSTKVYTTSTPMSTSQHSSNHGSTKAYTTSTPMSTSLHPNNHGSTKAHTTSTFISTFQHVSEGFKHHMFLL
ncbi:uncharacterized protein LOC134265584 [Saccostrea cucullata]|uniref:uncharacterized protein LOC134265584 n=1 Tax=Saccostrea cuccullata TaxID=36930 RepID=UPI002ED1EF40